MGFLIGFLTFILVMDCILLILLILIQLPKKEAGMGTAFGGGTTDALFGAGTGNALTNLTKYTALIFFVLSLGLSVINSHRSYQARIGLKKALQQQAPTPASLFLPSPAQSNRVLESVTGTNRLLTPVVATNNLAPTRVTPTPTPPPVAPSTNPAPKPAVSPATSPTTNAAATPAASPPK